MTYNYQQQRNYQQPRQKLTWEGLFANHGSNPQPKRVRIYSEESAVTFQQMGFDVWQQADGSFIVSYIPTI